MLATLMAGLMLVTFISASASVCSRGFSAPTFNGILKVHVFHPSPSVSNATAEDPIVHDAWVIADNIYPGNGSFWIPWNHLEQCYKRSIPSGGYLVIVYHPLYGNHSKIANITSGQTTTLVFYV